MVNQEMLDYIRAQGELGVSREEIKNALMGAGWSEADVNAGFNALASVPEPTDIPELGMTAEVGTPKNRIGVIAGAMVIGVLLVGVAFYVINQTLTESVGEMELVPAGSAGETLDLSEVQGNDNLAPENFVGIADSELVPTPVENEPKDESDGLEQLGSVLQEMARDQIVLANNLMNCTPHKSTHIDVITGQRTATKEVVGIVNGKCNYVEAMSTYTMNCSYTSEEWPAVAQFYIDTANAESLSTDIEFGASGATVTYVIDGIEVEDPLQHTMGNGSCQISYN